MKVIFNQGIDNQIDFINTNQERAKTIAIVAAVAAIVFVAIGIAVFSFCPFLGMGLFLLGGIALTISLSSLRYFHNANNDKAMLLRYRQIEAPPPTKAKQA